MADENEMSTQDEKHEDEEVIQEENIEQESEEESNEVNEESDDNSEQTIEEEIEEELEEKEEKASRQSRRDERIQELIEDNKMLRRLVEQGQNRRPQAERDTADESPVFDDPEIEKAFRTKLSRAQQEIRGQLGAVREELDATKFDRVLAKEGIDENSDEYEYINNKLQTWREEKAVNGHYFTRQEAYDILKSKNMLKIPNKKPVKKLTVIKKKPHVGIQSKTGKEAPSKGVVKKPFKSLSIEDKEKRLENVKF